jgi:hypothetical protein
VGPTVVPGPVAPPAAEGAGGPATEGAGAPAAAQTMTKEQSLEELLAPVLNSYPIANGGTDGAPGECRADVGGYLR